MLRNLFFLGLLGCILSGVFLFLRKDLKEEIDIRTFILPDPPELVGPLAPNTVLQNSEYVLKNQIVGPESLVVDENHIYATLHSGEIVKIKDGKIVERLRLRQQQGCGSFEAEPRCGRPLGLRRVKNEVFVVVDAYFGLFLVDMSKKNSTLLVDSRIPIDGKPLKFLNDLDIINEDEIIFSDSSPKWERRNVMRILLENVPEGRVLLHKISTKETKVLVDNLYFPNGIQLTSDKQNVLISECSMARIKKLNLKTLKLSTFAENLPGLPDNIRADDSGNIYVALASVRHSEKKSLLERIGGFTNLRYFLVKMFDGRFWNPIFEYVSTKYGIILVFNESGKITKSYQDPTGQVVTDVSQAVRLGNHLYLGSFRHAHIVKVKLND
ncbi:unnamed protein product [Auanema sp. JU1783]|nr:unnamed protein product [Auanema sp. JU1783]